MHQQRLGNCPRRHYEGRGLYTTTYFGCRHVKACTTRSPARPNVQASAHDSRPLLHIASHSLQRQLRQRARKVLGQHRSLLLHLFCYACCILAVVKAAKQHGKGKPQGYKNGGKNNAKSDAQEPAKKKQRGLECFVCGKPGHMARDCSHKQT